MIDKARFASVMALNKDTQKTLANALGISLSRLNAKINETGGAEFKQNEIALIKARYSLSPSETDLIFFAPKVS